MRLSEYERKLLLESAIYKKYASTPLTDHTIVTIRADLDKLTRCSLENLPIIKFLTELHHAIDATGQYDTDAMNTKIHSIYGSAAVCAETIKNMHADYTDDTVYHDNGAIVEVAITLSSGAATNTEVIPALAANQCFLLWIVLNATAAPASAYTLTFHSTDSTNRIITVVPGDLGKRFWVMFDGDTDNTNIQVDSAGGAGAEVLTLTAFGGTFT